MSVQLTRLARAARRADTARLALPAGWAAANRAAGLPVWDSWTEVALDSAADDICPEDCIETTLEAIQRGWHYRYLATNPDAPLRFQERAWVRAQDRERNRRAKR